MDATRTAAEWTAAVAAPFSTPPRYRPIRPLGRGGMGEVWEVEDELLARRVALKLGLRELDAAAERFVREARITARLQHPGILALYDTGRLEDGRPWYTMRLVPDGRTLRAAWAEAPDGDLRARLRPLLAVANALAYAHAEGLCHLDVKPDNVLLGAFGEVLLLDWGIARAVGEPSAAAGTPGYAPPDRGPTVDPADDVYAIGVLLHEAAAGGPFLGRPAALPGPLAALRDACVGAAGARPAARAVAEGLAAWLDDAERRRRAAALVARADAALPKAEALVAEAARARGRAAEALDALPRLAPIDAKAPAWDEEARAAALADEAAALEAEWEGALTAALAEVDLPEAHERLADRFLARLREQPGAPDARRWEGLVRAHGQERHRRWLAAPGGVSLAADADGLVVRAWRYEARRRRREPVFAWEAAGPLDGRELSAGSWLFLLSAPGRAEVRYPVEVGRGEHWDAGRVALPPAEALGPEDVYVPAGVARLGGDPAAADGLPAARRHVHGFVIRRFPVRAAEYVAWLDALAEDGDDAAIDRFQPQDRPSPDAPWRALWTRGPDGRFGRGVDTLGRPWAPDVPVSFVDVASAEAFAAWVAAREGHPWRLPTGLEYEKAARGVDGRPWPWGDGYDPLFACTAESHAGPVAPRPVEDFPLDESPHGVRGLAGNMRTWCANAWNRAGDDGDGRPPDARPDDALLREVRGGAYGVNPGFSRPAGRLAAPPGRRMSTLGVRLCRTWEG